MANTIPENASRFGGKPINPNIMPDLNAAVSEDWTLWGRVKREGLIAQGWNHGVQASNGTHDTGHCIDVSCRTLTNDEIRRLCASLNRHGFAAAFRPVGYRLGPRSVNTVEHIHAAWRGKANYWAVKAAISRIGPAYIEKVLARRERGHG